MNREMKHQHTLLVTFERDTGDDVEVIRARHPELPEVPYDEFPIEFFVQQVFDELEANPSLRERFHIGGTTEKPMWDNAFGWKRIGKNSEYTVTVQFIWPSDTAREKEAKRELVKELQRTYDVYGMAGFFQVR